MADQPSTLDILMRAGNRWTQHQDEGVDRAYLKHLADTLDLMRPAPPAVDTAARNRLAREAADARDERDTARAELADARELHDAVSIERNILSLEVDDLCTLVAEARARESDVRAEAAARRDADQRVLRDAQQDRDLYRDLLARLVVAVTGQPCPPGTDLPGRAAAACGHASRAAGHRHQFAYRGRRSPPGPCDCGTTFPPTRSPTTALEPHTTVGDTAGAPQPPPGAA